jgi:ubiquinone/menaquinone biosynthesis C-methylase UbiE
MKPGFTEQDTELFYDKRDAVYRSFWDKDGSVHWGLFNGNTGLDFPKACANLNVFMAQKAGIDESSRVLDVGCGNGTTSIWLSKAYGCRVVGSDISGVRIGNASQDLEAQPSELKQRVAFEKASATEMPFEDGCFTHVWSQAVIYHIPDKVKALLEVHRVLCESGLFVFDDLLKPKPDISPSARKYVYDRLLFDTDFTFESYQEQLRRTGFEVLYAQDLSTHLKTSYECLARMATAKADDSPDELRDEFRSLALAYEKTAQAVDDAEVGWGLYLCQKRAGGA